MITIIQQRAKCIGCNYCVELAPQRWRMSKKDGKGLVGSSSFWDVSFDRWQVETDVLLRGNIVNQIIDHFNTLWHSKEVKIIQTAQFI